MQMAGLREISVTVSLSDEQAEALLSIEGEDGFVDMQLTYPGQRLGILRESGLVNCCCWGDWQITDFGRQVRAKLLEGSE